MENEETKFKTNAILFESDSSLLYTLHSYHSTCISNPHAPLIIQPCSHTFTHMHFHPHALPFQIASHFIPPKPHALPSISSLQPHIHPTSSFQSPKHPHAFLITLPHNLPSFIQKIHPLPWLSIIPHHHFSTCTSPIL